MGNISDVKAKLGGTVALDEGGEQTLHDMTDVLLFFSKPAADSMAADTTSATAAPCFNGYDFSLRVVGVTLFSASALTAHADNYATITVLKDDAANGTPAAFATLDTDSDSGGSWVADTSKTMTITAANAVLAPGAKIHYAIAKAGSGVVVPITHFAVRCRRI